MTLSPRQRRRFYFALAILACAGMAAALVLNAFEENLVFFHSSSEVAAGKLPPERRFRLGGLVEDGSVKRSDGATVTFKITDLVHAVPVRYVGVLPDLFREGQGVVAEGKLGRDGVFVASEVLARHDETYMPPAAAKALQDAGQWKGPSAAPAPKPAPTPPAGPAAASPAASFPTTPAPAPPGAAQ